MGEFAISLRRLNDLEVIESLKDCVARERKATAHLLEVLAEFDVRRLHLGLGFSSTFDYCVRHLHFSERASYNRIAAARLARRFPIILEFIADSRISLTTVSLLAKHLNEHNFRSLLEEATHKSTRQVEVLVARIAPQPDAPTLVRKVTLPAAQAPETVAVRFEQPLVTLTAPVSERPVDVPPAVSTKPVLKPISPERYRVQFTIPEETREKLRAVQDLLRHSVPNGDLAQIFDRSLSALLSDLEKKKLAIVAIPREPRFKKSPSNARLIPAAVRREVWRRDKARCAFVGSEGRCRERGGLELHHVKPFATGGKAVVENIQLRCRAHNSYESQLYFEAPRAP